MKHERIGYADPQPDFPNENNDCVVRAISVAGCISYAEAHKALADAGRRNARGTKIQTSISALEKLFPKAASTPVPRQTLLYFMHTHRTGHYVVFVSRHAVAVVDGTLYDWKPGPRRIVKRFWKLV
jgi:hypothetical protein